MTPWERAVDAVRQRASGNRDAAATRVMIAVASDASVADDALRRSGRLTINFHPDRVAADGRAVASGLATDGRYRSQWVTWISNGGRSAVVGGQRHEWERALFGGAYDGADPQVIDFPVYGAFDLLRDPFGGSPRFGSSYVVLAPSVADRSTFCVGDSHVGPTDVGTADELTSILAGLAEQAAGGALLGRDLGVAGLIDLLAGGGVGDAPGRELDHYVEVQVHGGVDLARDVAEIVVDPSFRDTDVELDLTDAARRFGFRLRWHGGSELAVVDVPADFRGPEMPHLARAVAGRRDVIDAAAIGRTARATRPTPPLVDGDDPASEAQLLKYLWHTLLRFGSDASDARH
jgi:hypothetical protein